MSKSRAARSAGTQQSPSVVPDLNSVGGPSLTGSALRDLQGLAPSPCWESNFVLSASSLSTSLACERKPSHFVENFGEPLLHS